MSEATAGTLNNRPGAPVALWIFLAILWAQFFLVLAPSWSGATYYDYGWLIAPFAILFAWRRWHDLDRSASPARAPAWLWGLVGLGVVLLVPLRIVEQVDVYWRLTLWLHAAIVLGVTQVVLALLFGWRVSAGLLPATLFALLAVPIPTFIERELVQALTSQVVGLAGGALPLAGYPVDVAGNSLLVKGELLDVAEGCSGIRSFQSSAMAGICLGELLRLHWGKRVVLVCVALVWAAACNAARIFVLARLAHDRGPEAAGAAHDAVGFWILLLTYGGISLCAWGLTRVGGAPGRRVRKMEARST